MSPQMLFNVAQQALKLYRQGYRVANHSQFFSSGEAVALRNVKHGNSLCSEAVEIAAVLAILEEFAQEPGET